MAFPTTKVGCSSSCRRRPVSSSSPPLPGDRARLPLRLWTVVGRGEVEGGNPALLYALSVSSDGFTRYRGVGSGGTSPRLLNCCAKRWLRDMPLLLLLAREDGVVAPSFLRPPFSLFCSCGRFGIAVFSPELLYPYPWF